MTETIICSNCGHAFSPPGGIPDIECPECGTLQILAEEAPTQAQSPLDRPIERNHSSLEAQPKIRTQERTPPEAKVSEQKAVSERASSIPRTPPPQTLSHAGVKRGVRTSHFRRVFNTMGPVILVCLLFFGWVAYDKIIRVDSQMQAQKLAEQSIHSYRKGNLQEAKQFLDHAKTLSPRLPLVLSLEQLYEELEKRTSNSP